MGLKRTQSWTVYPMYVQCVWFCVQCSLFVKPSEVSLKERYATISVRPSQILSVQAAGLRFVLTQSLATSLFSFVSLWQAKGKKHKGDSMDLRQDIERRKKHSSRETVSKHEHGRDSEESSDSSRERSTEKTSKHHKHKYDGMISKTMLSKYGG